MLAKRNLLWLEKHNASASGRSILIVEDSEADVFFLLRAFVHARVRNPIVIARTGAEALACLHPQNPANLFPGVIFLDLRMPDPDGFALLRWKSTSKNLPKALWVAMSNFDTVRAINEAYAAGASTFLAKPLDFLDVQNLIHGFEHFWKVRQNQKTAAEIS